MDTKLTLKLDEEIIARAKAFAKANNTSLSKMVERYFEQITRQNTEEAALSPLVQSLYGIASGLGNSGSEQAEYYEYLLEKHSPKHAN